MKIDRAVQVWTAVTSRAQRHHVPVSALQVCLACVEELDLGGAAVVLVGAADTVEPICTTDVRIRDAESIQAGYGQGPGLDAVASGRPVLVEDLESPASARRWPVFAAEVARLGLHAMFSFPLAMGAARLGALDLFHDTQRELSSDQLVDALIYADTALTLVIDARCGIETPTDDALMAQHGLTLWSAQVHQAAGMMSVQLGVPVLDALVRLRGIAFSRGLPVIDVARAIVERELRFDPDVDPDSALDLYAKGQS